MPILGLEAYRETVAKALRGEISKPVFNGTVEHACIVVEQSFKVAQTSVDLLTNSLDPICYGLPQVREAMMQFVARPASKLTILIEDANAASAIRRGQNALIGELRAVADERLDVRQVPEALVEQYDYNLLLVDNTGYRFEEVREKPIAVVAGGEDNADVRANLSRIFGVLAENSLPLL